jgi:hypothetical protein
MTLAFLHPPGEEQVAAGNLSEVEGVVSPDAGSCVVHSLDVALEVSVGDVV